MPSFDEALEAAEQQDQIQQLRRALDNSYRELAKHKDKTAQLIDVVHSAAYDAMLSMGPIEPVPTPKLHGKGKAEVALWHLTDWQGAKVTPSYNSEIMRKRVMEYCEKAVRITEMHRNDHPVNECFILFTGDMVEGLFNFSTQPFEIDATIFGQYVNVSRLLVDVVRTALANYKKVTVLSEWGNHGRIGSKRDSVPKSDNIDRMCYELARQLLENEKRLSWSGGAEDIQYGEIGEYRFLAMHGDEVGRMGFASPSAWQAAGNRWQAGAYHKPFRDIYLGHYHRFAQEPIQGMGAIYWTGSTESDNRYARDSMAVSGMPSQRLHFIDPVKGRVTAQYQVWLT